LGFASVKKKGGGKKGNYPLPKFTSSEKGSGRIEKQQHRGRIREIYLPGTKEKFRGGGRLLYTVLRGCLLQNKNKKKWNWKVPVGVGPGPKDRQKGRKRRKNMGRGWGCKIKK